MTTFRRFCCNDLLRLVPINLQPTKTIPDTFFYMNLLAKWPANCHVVYLPGGQITGYTLGIIEGIGVGRCGWVSLLSFSIPDGLDLGTKLIKLLEDNCDKIYNAYYMKLLIPSNDKDTLMGIQKLGFKIFTFHQKESSDLDHQIEIRKPFPRAAWLQKGVSVREIVAAEDLLRSTG